MKTLLLLWLACKMVNTTTHNTNFSFSPFSLFISPPHPLWNLSHLIPRLFYLPTPPSLEFEQPHSQGLSSPQPTLSGFWATLFQGSFISPPHPLWNLSNLIPRVFYLPTPPSLEFEQPHSLGLSSPQPTLSEFWATLFPGSFISPPHPLWNLSNLIPRVFHLPTPPSLEFEQPHFQGLLSPHPTLSGIWATSFPGSFISPPHPLWNLSNFIPRVFHLPTPPSLEFQQPYSQDLSSPHPTLSGFWATSFLGSFISPPHPLWNLSNLIPRVFYLPTPPSLEFEQLHSKGLSSPHPTLSGISATLFPGSFISPPHPLWNFSNLIPRIFHLPTPPSLDFEQLHSLGLLSPHPTLSGIWATSFPGSFISPPHPLWNLSNFIPRVFHLPTKPSLEFQQPYSQGLSSPHPTLSGSWATSFPGSFISPTNPHWNLSNLVPRVFHFPNQPSL